MEAYSVYAYDDYRKFISDYFKQMPTGTKSKVAHSLGVHTSLLPQVLSGACELSPEQANKFSKYLGHDKDETFFFLLLVLKARAGSTSLRQTIQEQIEGKKRDKSEISNRVKNDKAISETDQGKFYSSYLYAAIHVLSSISKFNSIEKIAQVLGRTEQEIMRSVDFLKKINVVHQAGTKVTPGSAHIHLSSDSSQISNHHLNWRLKTIEKIRENPKEDLHYSGAFSLSHEDALKIKNILISSIATSTQVAVKSSEETAYILCADFFPLSKEL